MADHPRMNPDTPYEWFVSETRTFEKNGSTVLIVKSSCTSEDLTLIEEFWMDAEGGNPAMDDRLRQLGHSSPMNPTHQDFPFRKGKHFVAKVYPILLGNKCAHRDYVFNCDSFQRCDTEASDRGGDTKARETVGVRKSVESMCHKISSRTERLDWCRERGSEYLRALHDLEKDKLV